MKKCGSQNAKVFCLACIVTLLNRALMPQAANAATSWDVYLLAGQSNMDGRAKAVELSDEQRKPLANVIIFYRNPPVSSDGWQPLTPGYSVAPGYKGKLPSPTFGPEIGFATAMLHASRDSHLALIKGPKGGTSLAKDWNPGTKGELATQGPCYRNFIETVKLALKALTKDGDTYAIRGLLWHQGESDAGSSAALYQQRLTALIVRLREDIGQPDLPFVIGEVYDNGHRDSILTAQRAVATATPHVGLAESNALKTSDNGTHFDTPSQLTLGERFAAAMLKLLPK